jgi:hypothetical protein
MLLAKSYKQKQLVLEHLLAHTPKQTSIHHGIHLSMVYKWAIDKIHATHKSNQTRNWKEPMHPTYIEQKVHESSIQARKDGICVTLAGIAHRVCPSSARSIFNISGWIKGGIYEIHSTGCHDGS